MNREIEELTDDDLMELWPEIGGTPHLFEYGKDELRQVLITGECADENGEPITLSLGYYTMAAIVNTLVDLGFETPFSAADKMAQATILGSEVIGVLEFIRKNNLKQEKGKWVARDVNNDWLGFYGEATDLQVYQQYKKQEINLL